MIWFKSFAVGLLAVLVTIPIGFVLLGLILKAKSGLPSISIDIVSLSRDLVVRLVPFTGIRARIPLGISQTYASIRNPCFGAVSIKRAVKSNHFSLPLVAHICPVLANVGHFLTLFHRHIDWIKSRDG